MAPLVAQLRWEWMEMNRNSDSYQQFAPEEEAPRPVNGSAPQQNSLT